MRIVAKKHLGQNFLIDEEILQKIVDLIPVDITNIIEIGPGTGNLTKKILEKFPNITVLAIEKDLQFEKILDDLRSRFKNFDYILEDVLKFNFTDYLNEKSVVIGNLPYNISTKIVFNFLENYQFSRLIFMLQKEVAEKFVAKNNSKVSKLSVLASFLSDINLEFFVDRNFFNPIPKVDSAVLSFTLQKILNIEDYKKLRKILNICFPNKRKKIGKILRKYFPNIHFSFDYNLRPENLLQEDWILLLKNFI